MHVASSPSQDLTPEATGLGKLDREGQSQQGHNHSRHAGGALRGGSKEVLKSAESKCQTA